MSRVLSLQRITFWIKFIFWNLFHFSILSRHIPDFFLILIILSSVHCVNMHLPMFCGAYKLVFDVDIEWHGQKRPMCCMKISS